MKMQRITYLCKSCLYPREGMVEALIAVHVAGAFEHRILHHLGCRGCELGRH